jgi:GNAT superfamily N-acetyltransferase
MNFSSYSPLFVVLVIISSITISIERNKKMNNQTEPKKSGSFLATDKLGLPLVIEWQKTSIVSTDFAAAMREMWSFARDAYTPVEMKFLKAFPEVVGAEPYFKPFEQLFADGITNVDWDAATKTMESILQGHFVFDPAQFPEQVVAMFAQDSCYIVIAKDQTTGTPLGFITFLMRASYPTGNVKVMSLAVATTHQNRGLGKLLMSSICKIAPNIKRIFLCTRVTNTSALQAYRSWGFVTDEKPILDHPFNLAHWSFMEYKTEQSDILQKIAATLID